MQSIFTNILALSVFMYSLQQTMANRSTCKLMFVLVFLVNCFSSISVSSYSRPITISVKPALDCYFKLIRHTKSERIDIWGMKPVGVRITRIHRLGLVGLKHSPSLKRLLMLLNLLEWRSSSLYSWTLPKIVIIWKKYVK